MKAVLKEIIGVVYYYTGWGWGPYSLDMLCKICSGHVPWVETKILYRINLGLK